MLRTIPLKSRVVLWDMHCISNCTGQPWVILFSPDIGRKFRTSVGPLFIIQTVKNHFQIKASTHTWTRGVSQHSRRRVFNGWTRPEAFHQRGGRFSKPPLSGRTRCMKRATDPKTR